MKAQAIPIGQKVYVVEVLIFTWVGNVVAISMMVE
jgi:hypothetical protein